jgi:endonuclease G
MAKNPPPPAPAADLLLPIAVVVLLVLFLGLAAFLYYRSLHPAPPPVAKGPATPPPTQTAPAPFPPPDTTSDLVSDDRIIFAGMPRAKADAGPETAFTILKNRAYIVGYSESRKDPLWVTYRVFHNPTPFLLDRPSGRFLTDTRTAARVKDADFSRTGYDRGHMAPNSAIARCYGPEAQLETFLLSNICPQAPNLNEKVWERLEAQERQYADRFEEVWVTDGPIFGDVNGGATDRLAAGVAVPTAFYKILARQDGGVPKIFAVIMPQTVKGTELPQQYLTSVKEIETQTHLDFLWKLDDATEAAIETKSWPMW